MTFFNEPYGSISRTCTRPDPKQRALALNSRCPIALAALGLWVISALPSCSESQSASLDSEQAKKSTVDMVQHLIELSTPLDPTLTSDHHDKHLHARRAYLNELRGASHEVGLHALDKFLEVEEQTEPAAVLVRINLLDVAAHAATEETSPLLVSLFTEYGHKMDIRSEAIMLLGQTDPALAVEILTPVLMHTKRTSTMPADEFMLKAFVYGCEGSGQNPVPVLANVATNIHKGDAARHQAVHELGKHKELLANQALRSILVESTGNAYLRRKAAQALRDSMPREQACEVFELIASHEADNNFLMFLGDMIEDNCQ
ncbi:MAG: HEAT repeat protein [Planctomycetota bacterium]|jgi:HEAT repeat protein